MLFGVLLKIGMFQISILLKHDQVRRLDMQSIFLPTGHNLPLVAQYMFEYHKPEFQNVLNKIENNEYQVLQMLKQYN